MLIRMFYFFPFLRIFLICVFEQICLTQQSQYTAEGLAPMYQRWMHLPVYKGRIIHPQCPAIGERAQKMCYTHLTDWCSGSRLLHTVSLEGTFANMESMMSRVINQVQKTNRTSQAGWRVCNNMSHIPKQCRQRAQWRKCFGDECWFFTIHCLSTHHGEPQHTECCVLM